MSPAAANGRAPEHQRFRDIPWSRPIVEALVAREPKVGRLEVPFQHRADDRSAPTTLWRLLRPRMRGVLLALLLVVVEALLLQAGPLLVQLGIDHGVVASDFAFVALTAGLYAGSLIVGGVATGLRVAWSGRLAQALNYDQRISVFSHLQRLSMDFHEGEKAGRLMSRMTSDIEATNQMLQNGVVQLVVQVLTLVVVTVVLFVMNAMLAAITVFAIVPALAVLTQWFRIRSSRAYQWVRDSLANVLADLTENLNGIAVVLAHSRTQRNIGHHERLLRDYRDANVSSARYGSVYAAGSVAVGILGQGVLFLVGGEMVLHGALTIGELTAFILYLTAFFAPIQQIAQLYNTVQQGQAAIVKLGALLSVEPSVAEAPHAHDLPTVHGDLAFEHVDFGYDPTTLVLQDFDLRIPPGESVAIVGETGAGKSTVAKLVARFYDPLRGRVCIDGHDLRDVTLRSLRRQLGVVPQEPFLFAGTIRDNIVFGRPGATDAEIDEALHALGLQAFVASLPDGLDALCTERGASLSSGERQLIALARAFLSQPRVLVLDEATSNLDAVSEAHVEGALSTLMRGRTTILIAHRLSTAMRADRIVVLQHGRVVEIGAHDELIARGGRYADMFETWISDRAVA